MIRLIRNLTLLLSFFLNFPNAHAAQIPNGYLPVIIREDAPSSREIFDTSIRPYFQKTLQAFQNSEVRTLVLQGPVKNRINLTIVGDGYTAAEKDLFFSDALRTSKELFGATTFKNYLPLFNIFAVFVPSHDSGISDLTRKDTALGLYRDPPGSKRAIMPGKTQAIDAAIGLAPATDFPILLANDNFYGGLGGKYAITTRADESGAMVLRHELGHNFGGVGEEYDAGFVYTGANNSASRDVPWKKWVDGPVQGNEALFLNGSYLWAKLGSKPIHIDFNFPQPSGQGPFRFSTIISTVGWQTPDDVRVLLDGAQVKLEGVFTKDRSFFEIQTDRSLIPGHHTLDFQENLAGDHTLAFAELYGLAANYDTTPGHIDAYATFYEGGQSAGYRPTHQDCLMRNMRSKEFCSVDKENMWIRFLKRISLLDQVQVNQQKQVELKAPHLPELEIAWFRPVTGGTMAEIQELRNQWSWNAAKAPAGTYKVRVKFQTPEVRTYTNRFVAEQLFKIP